MRGVLLRFVYGIHDHRACAVTKKQIEKWFSGTPKEHVGREIDAAVEAGHLVMLRNGLDRKRAGYVYDITRMGVSYVFGDTVWDNTPELQARNREVYVEVWRD